ncbi:hypothetical protein EB796_010671 [Bugula neritina]|uniref:Uncharacterized protein n=1 Tax=Bugula neritina TaxID=10212 RepID=A0A7J7K078_BUGNE|nr:hypothetical protein EB796_010671 [Bugula neritina]
MTCPIKTPFIINCVASHIGAFIYCDLALILEPLLLLPTQWPVKIMAYSTITLSIECSWKSCHEVRPRAGAGTEQNLTVNSQQVLHHVI